MTWLRRELKDRPRAILSLKVEADVFKRSAETWHNQPFYLEPNKITAITSVSIFVNDPEETKVDVTDNVPPALPRDVGFDAELGRKILKVGYWCVALLAAVVVVLLFKR